MSSVIEVEGLRKSYQGVERVHGISFCVREGEIFGLIGVNGAGKSTTIEILEGYRPRDAGQVRVLDADPALRAREWRNRIGLVLQECELDPVHTVRETVTMFARYFSAPVGVSETIATVGLEPETNARIGHLSGGQKRRLDVALGLIGGPEVLFLDEPTTGLDPTARRDMWGVFDALRAKGTTVFLTTHYMDEAAHLADRIVILKAGEIVAEGTPAELSRGLDRQARVSCEIPPEMVAQVDALGIYSDGEFTSGILHFSTSDAQASLRTLLEWADRTGVELGHLQIIRPTLDDVFVQLAGEPTPDPDGDAR
jgi:ABC-2 type transport system ATP-binding protein